MEVVDHEATEAVDLDTLTPVDLPGIISLLGDLGAGTIITEEGVGCLFNRHATSVKRAVERGELPPPTRLFGANTWTVRALVAHIESRLAEAAKEAERTVQKIVHLSP